VRAAPGCVHGRMTLALTVSVSGRSGCSVGQARGLLRRLCGWELLHGRAGARRAGQAEDGLLPARQAPNQPGPQAPSPAHSPRPPRSVHHPESLPIAAWAAPYPTPPPPTPCPPTCPHPPPATPNQVPGGAGVQQVAPHRHGLPQGHQVILHEAQPGRQDRGGDGHAGAQSGRLGPQANGPAGGPAGVFEGAVQGQCKGSAGTEQGQCRVQVDQVGAPISALVLLECPSSGELSWEWTALSSGLPLHAFAACQRYPPPPHPPLLPSSLPAPQPPTNPHQPAPAHTHPLRWASSSAAASARTTWSCWRRA
jgi:hypothetical protein